ncbi:FAD-binding domain-containing protein [Ascobolus immersus RN42]|uniref:FAD-binding domain-containing protein n=1 Tax=Ascobolus immersus RN42 TaxID=1160509 RepID=A0A3N4ICH3_ASCIM|nr:FAD-binding domain-containing protein [Ascobolus immersus RN42]
MKFSTAIFIATTFSTTALAAVASKADCRCTPEQACWPAENQWKKLNETVGGKLIKGVPPAAVCHEPNYNEAECEKVKANFGKADFHVANAISPHNLPWSKYSCSPFTDKSEPCTMGGYAAYAIKALCYTDIQAGVKFARDNNLRLVVRNTGHDFLGRSTGHGALTIWTHHLKDTKFIPKYNKPWYKGPAIKAYAGVQVRELYDAVGKVGMETVGGECPSVGYTGGYIQGGGHGPLSGQYGMGADQALSFEVILPDGSFVTADPKQNADLYWALSGGGPGTYGIVYSVTSKVYPSQKYAGARLSFSAANSTQFWELVDWYHQATPEWTDLGIYSYALYGFLGPQLTFMLEPFLAPGMDSAQVDKLLTAFRAKIKDTLGTDATYTSSNYPDFTAAYKALFPDEGTNNGPLGGRLIPRSVVQKNPEGLSKAIRNIVDNGGLGIEFAVRPTLKVAGNPDNSVLPAWRDSELHFIIGSSYSSNTPTKEEIKKLDDTVTFDWNQGFKDISPDAGSYGNEGDFNEPNFQKEFYGKNYERLLKIKKKYDPKDLLWGKTNVGSEAWAEDEQGLLCRTKPTKPGKP